MQGWRRSWEDKLKCVKILSVKGHNSAKICRTWMISPHALLDLWYNICTKNHSNPCKDVGGVEKTNFDATEGRNDGRTEWRTKQTLNAPLPFYGGGIKIVAEFRGMHVSPAKHSFGKCDRKVWQTDGRTTDKVIPMCRYASQATQKGFGRCFDSSMGYKFR